MRIEALPVDPGHGQHVHQADRALEGHRVHEDVCRLTRLGLDVLEDLVLVVNDCVALADSLTHDLRHREMPLPVGLLLPVGLTRAPPSRAPGEAVPIAGDGCRALPA
jgi:hypothetical protein